MENRLAWSRAHVIINKISNGRSLKTWSAINSGGFKSYRIMQVKAVLDIISGNDAISMLTDVISAYQIDLEYNQKYLQALINFGQLYSNKNERNFSPNLKRKILLLWLQDDML